MYLFLTLVWCDRVVQVSAGGPKRVPVTQSGQKPVSMRVLGTTPGPQRVPRPANQQKPLGLPVSVKTMSPGDQNINPDQLKTATQTKQQDKPQRKHDFCRYVWSYNITSHWRHYNDSFPVAFQKLFPLEHPILPSKSFTIYTFYHVVTTLSFYT